MSISLKNKRTGAARTATGPSDVKANGPTILLIILTLRWPEALTTGTNLFVRMPPELAFAMGDLLTNGGVL